MSTLRSPPPLSLLLACLLFLCLGGPLARARGGAGPLTIGVVPFEGEQSGGNALAEALELELELVESVLVKDGRWLKRDVRGAGARAFEADVLRKIMKKRKFDIVLHGRREGRHLRVLAYGNDGRARIDERFALATDVDERARDIVRALTPQLGRWVALPPTEAPAGAARSVRPPAGGDDDGGLFVGAEPDAPASKVATPTPSGSARGSSGRRIVAADGEGTASPDRATRGESWLDNLPATDTDDRDDRPTRASRPGEPERDADGPRSASPAGAAGEKRARMADLDRADRDGPPGPMHRLAMAAGLDLSSWTYDFEAVHPEENLQLGGLLSTGAGARVSWWVEPAFGIEASFATRYMGLKVQEPPINPTSLVSLTYQLGLLGRARYRFSLEPAAVALGARVGYRLWGRGIDVQTNANDGGLQTVVPGWRQHALALGVEASGGWIAWQRRFELEFSAEVLPLTFYQEVPDNPGETSQAMGWRFEGLARIPIVAPVHAELGFTSTGSSIYFDGLGDRKWRREETGEAVAYRGGQATNAELGGSLAIGVAW